MRKPCCDKEGTNKGAWSKQEDQKLIDYINAHGEGCWHSLPKAAGLFRCGKSCRLRWINYLRPDIKRGNFDQDEEDLIIKLHALLGNRWSLIAGRLPGRTDNEVKNYWNSHIRRKLLRMGIDPNNHRLNQIRPLSNQNIINNNDNSLAPNYKNVREEDEKEEVLSESNKNTIINIHPITARDKSSVKSAAKVGELSDAASSSVEEEQNSGGSTSDINLDLTISVPNTASLAINDVGDGGGDNMRLGGSGDHEYYQSAISTDAQSNQIVQTTLLLFR